jgi:hypothetical protein
MTARDIEKVLRRSPFEPFSLYLSDGSQYAVRHPDQVTLTPRAVYVGIHDNSEQTVAQDVVICDLIHVTRIGPITRRRTRRRQ